MYGGFEQRTGRTKFFFSVAGEKISFRFLLGVSFSQEDIFVLFSYDECSFMCESVFDFLFLPSASAKQFLSDFNIFYCTNIALPRTCSSAPSACKCRCVLFCLRVCVSALLLFRPKNQYKFQSIHSRLDLFTGYFLAFILRSFFLPLVILISTLFQQTLNGLPVKMSRRRKLICSLDLSHYKNKFSKIYLLNKYK